MVISSAGGAIRAPLAAAGALCRRSSSALMGASRDGWTQKLRKTTGQCAGTIWISVLSKGKCSKIHKIRFTAQERQCCIKLVLPRVMRSNIRPETTKQMNLYMRANLSDEIFSVAFLNT